MDMIKVRYKKCKTDAKEPVYFREHDVCMDLFLAEHLILEPFESGIGKTGIILEIPEGYEGQVRGRSGLSSQGILVHFGTIENTYRGEIGILVTNLNKDKPIRFEKHTRIAQIAIVPITRVELIEAKELSETERGANGYGSSGV